MDIGKSIRHFREKNKLTQEQLAEQMNVTRQAVSNWENMKTRPDIDTIFRLSQIFDISAEELIYGKQRKTVHISFGFDRPEEIALKGLNLGSIIATVISYVNWGSTGWAILHGLLGWIYIIYFAIVHA